MGSYFKMFIIIILLYPAIIFAQITIVSPLYYSNSPILPLQPPKYGYNFYTKNLNIDCSSKTLSFEIKKTITRSDLCPASSDICFDKFSDTYDFGFGQIIESNLGIFGVTKYALIVDWGDGPATTIAAGVFDPMQNTCLTGTISHTYANYGQYNLSVYLDWCNPSNPTQNYRVYVNRTDNGYFFNQGINQCEFYNLEQNLNNYAISINENSCQNIEDSELEDNCISSFKLINGKKYIIDAWVSEENQHGKLEFLNPFIEIKFYDNSTQLISGSVQNLLPNKEMIDGWQKLYYEFEIPSNSESMTFQLGNNDASQNVYFDDIRIYPKDGSAQAYVYDPSSMRLMAILDDNNFASLYEYDQEGKLIRIKKETSRGIFTIKESRNSQVLKYSMP